mmetsp:Transcript_60932/g.157092  ORF Transcript_60932/g.157092 Transcript_60932/m.157092 type:complete len:521 (+) Transcript_60932:400-1962(+)
MRLGALDHMRLDFLQPLGRPARRLVADDLCSQLAAEHRALHATEELLAGPVAGQREVFDRRLLRGAVPVPAGDGRVHAPWHTHHRALLELGTSIWQLLTDLGGEEPLELLQGGIHDLLVGLLEPVDLATCEWRARREDELEHGLVGVLVLLAAGAHVRIHGQQRAAAEAQVVDVQQFPVEPHVDVDDRDALELIDLAEEGVVGPLLGHNAFHDVARHRGDVLVSLHDAAVAHEDVFDGAVLVEHELVHRGVEQDLATPLLNVLLHRRTEAVRLVAVEERHLQAVRLVQEAIHRSEHHSHGELVRIDEVERLGHGNEDLFIDAVRHAILLHELKYRHVVLLVNELLALHEHGQQRRGGLQLLRHREHLLVQQDRQGEVEGRRHALQEVERGELTRELLHGEDHLVALPLQTVLDVELGEEVHHVRVGTEEDVEAGLNPVAILVLPGGDLAAEHVPSLIHDGLMASIDKVLGARQARQAAADDRHLLLLALASVGQKLPGQGLALQVVVGLVDLRRLGEVLR